MALQIEDVHNAFPDGLALENLFDGQCVDQRGLSAVLAFNRSLELVDAHFHGFNFSMVLPRALSALVTSFPLGVRARAYFDGAGR